jgi:N-acetylmuramic acid 6-phosphate etherase
VTENVDQRFSDFDLWSSYDMVLAIYNEQIAALTAIKDVVQNIASAAEDASETLHDYGRLVYVGAGTSGRLAVQDGTELTPTFGWPTERMVFCIAGGSEALMRSVEGAEDLAEKGAQEILKAEVGPKDVVFCVAASGRTPYTLAALRKANELGALTIGIANNPDTPILNEARHSILAETGSELIAGSTRMKAGTAQKAILNMLSTSIMSKMGRVYNGLMVDMIVSNKKLEKRAIKMVSTIAKCDLIQAEDALRQTDFHIKTAILICLGKTITESKELLSQYNNNLRTVLANLT